MMRMAVELLDSERVAQLRTGRLTYPEVDATLGELPGRDRTLRLDAGGQSRGTVRVSLAAREGAVVNVVFVSLLGKLREHLLRAGRR
jgi:hypothetical protein